MKNPYCILIEDPKNRHNHKANKIYQFSQDGIKLLAEYYNQKYSDNPKISNIICEIEPLDLINKNPEIADKVSSQAVDKIMLLERHSSQKILLSFSNANDESILFHSIPLLITEDKLILLTTERDEIAREIYSKIAKKLNLKLIEQLSTRNLSYQHDQISCHMIAGGILKDIKHRDLDLICSLENGYKINPDLAKILKYSQSMEYNIQIGNDALLTKIKKDGLTLEEYVQKGKSSKFNSRIQEKHINFLEKTFKIKPSNDIKVSVFNLLKISKNKESSL